MLIQDLILIHDSILDKDPLHMPVHKDKWDIHVGDDIINMRSAHGYSIFSDIEYVNAPSGRILVRSDSDILASLDGHSRYKITTHHNGVHVCGIRIRPSMKKPSTCNIL